MSQTIEQLKEQLQNAGIDLSLWGRGSAKTIEHLQKEILEGESILVYQEDGKLVRKLLGVCASVFYTDPSGNTLKLKEQKQVFDDGRERVRESAVSVSEKMKPGENPKDAIIRGVREELSIDGDIFPVEIKTTIKLKESPSYPGLLTEYTTQTFRVDLNSGQFKAEGYVEKQDDITTYFIWEK